MRYTLEAGRGIVRDGVRIASVTSVASADGSTRYAITPAELDTFAHAIVAALNTVATGVSYTRAEIVNGTGFRRNARFIAEMG